MALEASWSLRKLRVQVHRNHPFEHVLPVLRPLLAYGGFDLETVLGAYDDSLSLAGLERADLELVWLDVTRLRGSLDAEALVAWFGERLAALRSRTSAPILVCDAPGREEAERRWNGSLALAVDAIPGARLCPVSSIAAELGSEFHDDRLRGISGTNLSDAAWVQIARWLGLRWIPAAVSPRIKAIVVDLDETLYAGVLGEDGPQGVVLGEGHRALQDALVEQSGRGILLGAVSRNDPRDVERLLEQRSDFPLRPRHLSARSVSWRPKPEGLVEVARQLRIGLDSVLYVDDNPGELAEIAATLPEVRVVHAADPVTTAAAIGWFPGLHAFTRSEADALRADDLAASRLRDAAVRESVDPLDYLRSLDVELRFELDPRREIGRLVELSRKTNQFNTGMRRFEEPVVASRLTDPQSRTVGVWLRDRLSDSGLIAAIFARREGTCLHVDEVAVSCRALGRHLEDVIVTEALGHVLEELPATEVRFGFRPGPRNEPARAWLSRYTNAVCGEGGVSMSSSDAVARRSRAALPVRISWGSSP
jgi:FkbH-like protein